MKAPVPAAAAEVALPLLPCHRRLKICLEYEQLVGSVVAVTSESVPEVKNHSRKPVLQQAVARDSTKIQFQRLVIPLPDVSRENVQPTTVCAPTPENLA